MAFNLVRGGVLLGIGVAVGVGVAVFGPAIWRAGRPVAKSALRAGLDGYAAAQLAAARMGEEAEDLVAEVIFEMTETQEAGASHEPAPADTGVEDETRGAAAV